MRPTGCWTWGLPPQINQILSALPEERQTLFSATLPSDLTQFIEAGVNDPVRVMATPSATTADGIAQALHYTTHTGKPDLLLSLLKHEEGDCPHVHGPSIGRIM